MLNQTLNNRYRITARLGKGAMGEVYRATDRQMRQEVALKVIAGDLALNKEMLARFRREGESLRQLRHRNIVAFWEMFDYRDQQIIVMEYVPGGNLHDLIQRGRLPVAEAVHIALELTDALAQAHHIHIIHRDIKPENVLMAEGVTPKLTDFGVARLLSETGRLTGTGALVGTPYYMSPEAWQGKALDAQADVWSLGVVLYEMVTGQVPFPGDTLPAVMSKVLMEAPPDLRVLSPDLPESLVKIIERALTREPAQRYKTMRQFAVDLEAVEAELRLAQDEARRKAEAEQKAGATVLAPDEARRQTEARQRASAAGPAPAAVPRGTGAEQKTSAAAAVPVEAPRSTGQAGRTEIVPPRPISEAPPVAGPGGIPRRVLVMGGAALVIVCLLVAGSVGAWAAINALRPTASPTASVTLTASPTATASPTPQPPSATPTLTGTLTPEYRALTPEPPTATQTPAPPTATQIPPTATRVPPTRIPPTSTSPPVSGDRGLRITGSIMWATQPLPGAKAVLKEIGDYYTLPALLEAVAGADGRFVIENPPAGHFAIYGVAPSDEFMGWKGWDVTVRAGQAVDVGTFYLSKKMQLLEPPSGASVSTTTPVLRWASFPGAVRYEMLVHNNATGQAVMSQATTDTSIVVSPPLVSGGSYQWSVACFDAAGNELAYYSAWYFTVQ